MKRILVTGGAGFVGSHLVDELVMLGHNVTVVDDLSNGTLQNISLVRDRICFVQCDVSKPLLMQGDYDVIFHLACFPRSQSFVNPRRDVEVNVIGMVNVLELARKDDAKVIFSSNSGIYDTSKIPINERTLDNPKTPYDLDKLQAENYLRLYNKTYGVKYVVFRFATVYGPRQRVSQEWKPVIMEFITKLKNREPPTIYWDGEQTRDFIFVKDIVRALVLAVDVKEAENETMILGSGKETSINELYCTVSRLMNAYIKPKRGPMQLGDIRRMLYDCRKAQRILGWHPEVTLKQGITEILNQT
ncbi:NAD-dependent epimerase/dehydratase family protein [Candidatus Bathyarchaeota archaeon]|nr:NAD-dependent epimerase/dehydratase family protein [Candidatus Bathyarchaeota archaeon]